MLIVCPSCATSYLIDPASVGPGRMVRCVRCKTTWFAGGPKSAPEVTSFVDGVIKEAEAHATGDPKASFGSTESALPPDNLPRATDDFGTEPPAPIPEAPPLVEQGTHIEVAVAPGPIAITDAPSLVPPLEQPPLLGAAHADADNEEIETFTARRQRLKMRRQKARRSSRWVALVLVLFAFNVALVGARDEVVRYLPQTASLFAAIGLPVNLRSLKFENVRISKEGQDGVNVLVIEGTIVSAARKPVEVPRLRFAARNATGQEVYAWTAQPSRSILEPGERLDFSSRLASPPAEASDVMVRFFSTQDAVPGAK